MNDNKRERYRRYAAEQRKLMPEVFLEYKRLWRLAFGSGDKNSKFRSKVWRETYPERSKQLKDEWRIKNPNKVMDSVHRRRAIVSNQTTENCSSKIDCMKSLSRFCHWCCDRLTDKNFTIDHVIPLIRGGKHCPDNLVTACKKCNSSRKDKLIEEWEWTLV